MLLNNSANQLNNIKFSWEEFSSFWPPQKNRWKIDPSKIRIWFQRTSIYGEAYLTWTFEHVEKCLMRIFISLLISLSLQYWYLLSLFLFSFLKFYIIKDCMLHFPLIWTSNISAIYSSVAWLICLTTVTENLQNYRRNMSISK